MIWIAMVLAAVGLALVRAGLRSRYVGDRIHCASCNFDLSGSAGRCPECGAFLARPMAVHVGRRERRRRLAIAGATLVLLGGGLAAARVMGVARGATFYSVAPDWACMWVMRHGAYGSRVGAAEELAGRADAGSLSAQDRGELATHLLVLAEAAPHVVLRLNVLRMLSRLVEAGLLPETKTASVVETILDWQADRARDWLPEAGHIVETAFLQGDLPEELFARYLRQYARPRLVASGPGPHRPGQGVPVYLLWDARGGTVPLRAKLVVPELSKPPEARPEGVIRWLRDDYVSPLTWYTLPPERGEHVLAGEVWYQFDEGCLANPMWVQGRRVMLSTRRAIEGQPWLRVTVPVSARFSIEGTGPSTIQDRLRTMFCVFSNRSTLVIVGHMADPFLTSHIEVVWVRGGEEEVVASGKFQTSAAWTRFFLTGSRHWSFRTEPPSISLPLPPISMTSSEAEGTVVLRIKSASSDGQDLAMPLELRFEGVHTGR